jgi:O-antigen/teichoic acid export membrane protein
VERLEATRDDLTTVARGGLLNLVGVVTNTVFNFMLVVIVTRGLGGTATGIFFESIALFHIAATAAQWGADVGAVRTIPRYRTLGRLADVRHSIRAALVPPFVVGVVFAAALFYLAAPLGALLTNGAHGEDLTPALRALAPFLPISTAYIVSLAVTRGFGTMVPTNLIDKMGKALAQPALVFFVIVAGFSGAALAVAWAIPFALGLAAALVWSRVLLRRIDIGSADDGSTSMGRRHVFREFWRFTAPRGLASMFAVIVLWLDTLLIGALRSPGEAGVYAAATRYLAFGQFVGVAIAQVVGPKLSEVLTARHQDRARSVYATATWWLMALAWPIYLTMIVLAPALLSVFGSGYSDASTVLAILGSTMLVATLVGPVDIVLLMAGKSSWNLLNTLLAVVVNVVLNLLLIPPLGITGSAIAWSASILVNNLLPLAQIWKVVDLHPFGRGSVMVGVSALFCFGLLGLVARSLLGQTLQAVVLTAVIGGSLYLGLLWRFREALQLAVLREAIRRRPSPTGEDALREIPSIQAS